MIRWSLHSGPKDTSKTSPRPRRRATQTATASIGKPFFNPTGLPRARIRDSDRTRMCSDGSEGRRSPSPTGLTDRVKGGQIWSAKSLPEKPEGSTERFLGMAPLRLAVGFVTALFQPQQKPSGLLCSPVIGNRDRCRRQGSQGDPQRSLGQR